MTVFLAAARLQLWTARRDPTDLLTLVVTPIFTAMFLSIMQYAGRDDLTGSAILAPVLIGLWMTAVNLGGGLIDADRWQGTLEQIIAAPAAFAVIILGRIAAITFLGLLTFAEALVVARLFFGEPLNVAHPGVLVAGLTASAFAMAGTATLMATSFVLARSALRFQNALSYPFYVLGGVLVPVSFLPDWLQPLSRIVFLSWSADLLRATLDPQPIAGVGWRLAVIVGLGATAFGLGRALLRVILNRVRATGSIGYV